MFQEIPTNQEELKAFQVANKTSEDNKKLWAELWSKGFYVQPIGNLHIGEIDYLIVTCAPPAITPRQQFLGASN